MIILTTELQARFDRLWTELRKSFEGQNLSEEELNEECIIFLEGRVLSYLVAKDKQKHVCPGCGGPLNSKDDYCPACDENISEPYLEVVLRHRDARPCPVCKNPDACDSYCPTCDV